MIRSIVRTVGELMITVGLVALLYVGYAIWWTSGATTAEQDRLLADLATSAPAIVGDGNGTGTGSGGKGNGSGKGSADGIVKPANGEGVAVLRIPRLGDSWKWAIVEGVERSNLKFGPGHYPDTVLPGQVGNFAVAGHQVTHGSPFSQLSQMRAGDAILVDFQGNRYTYVVDSTQVVSPSAVEVVLPVPNQPGKKPTEKLITLTTCHPPLRSYERFVVHGHLDSTTPLS